MKVLTKLEELALVLFSIYLFSTLPYRWWVLPVLFLTPDLSLLGNLFGKRIGAISYNFIHLKALAIGAYLLGSLLGVPLLSLLGIVLLGHSSFDRLLGLGLLDIPGKDQPVLRPTGQGA